MLYLDEFAVEFQIKLCQSRCVAKEGITCPKCQKQKQKEDLCVLGKAWLNLPEKISN